MFIILHDKVIWKRHAHWVKFMPVRNALRCLPILKLCSDRNFAEMAVIALSRHTQMQPSLSAPFLVQIHWSAAVWSIAFVIR